MAESEIELNLIDVVRRIVRGRYTLAIAAVAGLLCGIALALTIKPWFQATAAFLPPKNNEISSASPQNILFGKGDDSDTYLGLLSSESVANEIIDRLSLLQDFGDGHRSVARANLAAASKFTVNKNSIISVSVRAKTPELAASIANAYLEALYKLNGEMVESASDHRRKFFEEQIASQKRELEQAETGLEKTQQQTGMVLPAGEAQAGLTATASLQAQIGAAETRLAGLLVSETEQNADVILARSQLNQLRAQLVHQQSDAERKGPGGGLASTGKLPEMALENARKERDVRLRETIYSTLVQQYERARIAALDPGPQLQIIDHASVPERKAGPPRTLLALGGLILGFFLGLAYIILAEPARGFLHSIREPQIPAAR